MITPPPYFEYIRRESANRWDQLGKDPGLAAPWYLLFKQIQSPRHVLSELLQNADDAHATSASVSIVDNTFIFRHNGQDFTEDNFRSLCQFGYSNKRILHTIGFRGIGFKCTFSLGDKVRLRTPSLSITFQKDRFTEPIWSTHNAHSQDFTEVRVKIENLRQQKELENNLEDWIQSPYSLLFFNHILSLTINDTEISFNDNRIGPVSGSVIYNLQGLNNSTFIRLRSEPIQFPGDVLAEIKQERMLPEDDVTDFPPCTIDIVLGLEGRLYVVLPTEVMTVLPYGCNAPFIQDPARLKIKDPEISVTNRWLLNTIGDFAAKKMIEWVENENLDISTRCEAYDLFPSLVERGHQVGDMCGKIIEEAFLNRIKNEMHIINEDGNLKGTLDCISISHNLFDIWSTQQLGTIVDVEPTQILNRYISTGNKKKLTDYEQVEIFDTSTLVSHLEEISPPKPKCWKQLFDLWIYLYPEMLDYFSQVRKHLSLKIMPIQGDDFLYSASDVVRFGDKKLLNERSDWKFLYDHVKSLNPNWVRYIGNVRIAAEKTDDIESLKRCGITLQILKATNLENSSDVSLIIDQVAHKLLHKEDTTVENFIYLAQIAAKLNATIKENFLFITRDGNPRSIKENLVYDISGDLNALFDRSWLDIHHINSIYTDSLIYCTKEEWEKWVKSGKSKIHVSIPFNKTSISIYNKNRLESILTERGLTEPPEYQYMRDYFVLDDWDFPDRQWDHWCELETSNQHIWSMIVDNIIMDPLESWKTRQSTNVHQVSKKNTMRQITSKPVLPAWVVKLRSKSCLKSTENTYCIPSELLIRNPETDPYFGTDNFVNSLYDTESNYELLIKFGVRESPSGPEKILDRLMDLTTVNDPPIEEVDKWYRLIDSILTRCDTETLLAVKQSFQDHPLILSHNKTWLKSDEVFIHVSDSEFSEFAIVHPVFTHLRLWSRVDVAERPSIDEIIKRLKSLSSRQKLSIEEQKRVNSAITWSPLKIWDELKHWINLSGEWVPTNSLKYSMRMQSLIPWKNLYTDVKKQTADFHRLPESIYSQKPFCDLPSLAETVHFEISELDTNCYEKVSKEWINSVGSYFCRIQSKDVNVEQLLIDHGARLRDTETILQNQLSILPYIDQIPVGTPKSVKAVWKGQSLYVTSISSSQSYKSIVGEFIKTFNNIELADAIRACYERSAIFISEYFHENFRLSEEDINLSDETKDNGGAEGKEDYTSSKTEEIPVIDNTDNTDHPPDEEIEIVKRKRHRANRSALLITKYAESNGYRFDENKGKYIHEDGRVLQRNSSKQFPWVELSTSHDDLKYYHIEDHCIYSQPLSLDSELWNLIQSNPNLYGLILVDTRKNPISFSGTELLELVECGRIKLFPAEYRLVYANKVTE